MSRLEKKCFIAATGTHLFLFLLVIFGSAFFVSHDKLSDVRPLRVVPTKLIDGALAGGGGNPNVAPSDDQQKGQTLAPQPVQPLPQPAPARPVQPPPKPEVKRTEPKTVIKRDKPEPAKPTKPTKEVAKETSKPKPDSTKVSKDPPIELKAVTRTNEDKVREAREAEAQAQASAERAARRRAAEAISKATAELRSGFSQGTKVEIWGTGGEAYADYADFVKSVYEDAWVVSDQLTDEDGTAKVTVTIARSGRVISAHIERHSGDAMLDKSVQRALDKVKFVAPFPADTHDEQRTFTINFNLKAKRLLG